MNKPFRTVMVLLLYVVTITSCRKDTENTGSDGSEFFVSATSLATYPKEIQIGSLKVPHAFTMVRPMSPFFIKLL